MIDGFFGSKARVKILKQFLLHSDQKYYLRQLARDLKLQVNSARRELKNLETCGLLVTAVDNVSTKVSDKKYYQVNQDFVLFPELKALILKSQTLAGQNFVAQLKKISSPKLVILSGVFVGQNGTDTDMLAVTKVAKGRFLELVKKLEQELGTEINFTLMDESEFKYRQEIVDIFLHTILEGKKIVLVNEWNLPLSDRVGERKILEKVDKK
jgi:DNA-binding transcriptional regulator YhcF (GntR family)